MSTSSGSRVATALGLAFDGTVSSIAYCDARLHPPRATAPSGRRTTNTGGNTRSAGIEERVVGHEVAAHEIGARRRRRRGGAPAGPSHGSGSSRLMIDTVSAGVVAADHVLVAVGQHDHVAGRRRGAARRRRRSPSTSRRPRCGTGQAFGAGPERAGERQRRRLERERLGELGPEEDRAVEADLLERGPQAGPVSRSGAPVPRSFPCAPSLRILRSDDTSAHVTEDTRTGTARPDVSQTHPRHRRNEHGLPSPHPRGRHGP